MSRRNRTSTVKGPNSALTEFLRNEGITDGFRSGRLGRQSESAEPEEQEIITISGAPSDSDEDLRAAAREKRGESDSDSDSDFELGKKFGEEDNCVDCGTTFNLSVYSRFDNNKKGYLCEGCNEQLKKRERNARRNELNARKKRKKVAQALLDKSKVKVPSLQDVCIKKITSNIGDVEALGDIGQLNSNKISKILSKNRSLTSSTISLFLGPGLKSLKFWDCSNVDSDSLNKIASFCPNLESLTLFMCGNLHNDNLQYYKTNLPNLTELCLNGPFLISDPVWQEFFEEGCLNLAKFEIRNTHRFGNDSLICLLENCGKQLTSLKLSRLDGLDSQAVLELIPHYVLALTEFEISYPGKEDVVTNDLLVNLCSVTGSTLQSLNLDGCSDLTDSFLINGLQFCPNLTTLSLKNLDMLTDEGFAQAFLTYPLVNSGLLHVDLTKCIGLGDQAMYAFFLHSAATLVELSINSVYGLSKDFLLQIFTSDDHPSKVTIKRNIEEEKEDAGPLYSYLTFSHLTKLDIGFVRSVDNEVLSYISDNCAKLKFLEVYGNSKCNAKAKVRPDLMVIGRQHDTA